MKRKRNHKMPVEENLLLILFFAGFTAGILCLNLWWNQKNSTAESMGLYALAAVLQGEWSRKEYLWYLWKYRGCLFLMFVLSGITIFGVPMAAAAVIVLGAFMGGLLTLGLLEFGIKGGILALGFLLPQFLFYVPVCFGLGGIVYRISKKGWESIGVSAVEYRQYLLAAFLFLLLFALGIWMEVWVNPLICDFLIRRLKII